MSNIGIITKNFGQGTVIVTANTFSGYNSGYGKASVDLWRKIIEFAGHGCWDEKILIGLLDFRNEDYATKLYDISPVTVDELTMPMLAAIDINDYDLLFFAGLPESASEDIQTKIEQFVLNGGGVVIESPIISGTIDIISKLDNVPVTTIQRPFLNKGYWTEVGKGSQLYSEKAYIPIMTSIQASTLPTGWGVLVSDVETIYGNADEESQQNNQSNGSYVSLFSVHVGGNFNKGVVVIEESI